MTTAGAYPHHQLYGAFVHRELSIAWISQALLLGGRHQFDIGIAASDACSAPRPFRCLEFGCGHGLNLILNAAAHPEGEFYGVDLNPSHVAGAAARAQQLGLSNVTFALADLQSFACGRPRQGPCADWPEQVDLVIAHGVAAWVPPEVRQSLVAAAAAMLRPGGVFLCSYNTYPGWLSQSPLVMLCQEQALRGGGEASAPLIRATAERLGAVLGPADAPHPLGAAFPSLRQALERMPSQPAPYLEGEYSGSHQPLYVGPMHRLCAEHGLTAVGSATLPEQCPVLLDPARRELLEQADDPALREVLFDLLINQSFRRDLFAHGVRPPVPAWRRQTLWQRSVLLRNGAWPEDGRFETSLGHIELDVSFCQSLRQRLEAAPLELAELCQLTGQPLDELLPLLAVLIHDERISLAGLSDRERDDSTATAIAGFNDRVVERAINGDPLGWLVSPLLLQPVPVSLVHGFFRELLGLPLSPAEVAQMVAMGVDQMGGTWQDPSGQPLVDPDRRNAQLVAAWHAFQAEQLPQWRRLGLLPPSATP